MTQDHINVGPLRPTVGPLARLGGAAASQPLGGGSLPNQVGELQQMFRALQDQVYAWGQFFDQLISVPMMIASGDNHQPGVVPDPGGTAGTSKFLREDATYANVNYSTGTYAASAHKSAVQSIATGGVAPLFGVALVFDTNDISTGASVIHSVTVNNTRFTAPITGLYLAVGQLTFATDATGTFRSLTVCVNGARASVVPGEVIPPGTAPGMNASALISLTAGDYVEFVADHDAVGALNTNAEFTFGALTLVGVA